MKRVFTILLVICAVIVSGCTSQAPATVPPVASPTTQSVPANTAIPDVTGLWKGSGTGFTTLDDFTDFPTTIYNISKQKGQVFTGRKEYPRTDGKTYYESFAGMVTVNGEIYEADSLGGFSMGRLTGPNSMELNYLEEGNDTKAIVITLYRE